MSEQLVLEAVMNKGVASSRGISQRLFALWFDAFVYNQIWEDPRVDLAALELEGDSRILAISSGGCNVMNYALEGPESITAVDLNRHHIYLLRLKIAALLHLPGHDEFFAFFGYGRTDAATQLYGKHIEPKLDEATRAYWSSVRTIRGPRIRLFERGGLFDHSRNGYFLRFFHGLSRMFGIHPEEILEATTAEEQAAAYDRSIAPFFDNFIVRMIGRLPLTAFGLGIPPQQYDELKTDSQGGSIIDTYRARVRRLACDFPVADNYFAWQAFARKYDTEARIAIPDYLKRENYETLKVNAGRISTRITSVTEELRTQPAGSFNRFVFLDAPDWMDRETLNGLTKLIEEKAERGSRVIMRCAGRNSPLCASGRLFYDSELSEELFRRDRSSIYGGFHVYSLR